MSRIVIADPQPFMLAALRQRLADAGHEVIGEAGDGRQALELVRHQHPDLLILELDLPRLGGMELLRRLHHDAPQQKALVFTHLPAAHYQGLCLEAGARGFVHKDEHPEELDDAVRLVLGGRRVFSARTTHVGTEAPGSGEHITPRELTVLRYLSQGYRIKDIAEELAISDRTVSTYKARLLEKTQTDSLVDLVEAAKVRGLMNNSVVENLALQQPLPSSKAQDLARLLEILPSPISLWSRQGELLACNRHYLDAYGKSEAQMLGSRVFDLGVVAAEDSARLRREFLDGAAGDKLFTMVVSGTLHGEHRIIRLIGVPLREDDGESIGVVCSFVDITEHERDVERLQEAKAYLDGMRASRTRYLHYSFADMLEETRAAQRSLKIARDAHPGDRPLEDMAGNLARIEEKFEILLDLLLLEGGNEPRIPQPLELNRLTESILVEIHPGLAFQPAAHPQYGWIDTTRYLHLIRALMFAVARSGLSLRQIIASAEALHHGEMSWRLALLAEPGQDLPAHLADLEQRPGLQIARMICELLGGELRLGDENDPDCAGLIQLKLVRSSSSH